MRLAPQEIQGVFGPPLAEGDDLVAPRGFGDQRRPVLAGLGLDQLVGRGRADLLVAVI